MAWEWSSSAALILSFAAAIKSVSSFRFAVTPIASLAVGFGILLRDVSQLVIAFAWSPINFMMASTESSNDPLPRRMMSSRGWLSDLRVYSLLTKSRGGWATWAQVSSTVRLSDWSALRRRNKPPDPSK